MEGDSLGFTMVPYICMAGAGLSAGWIADRALQRGVGLLTLRRGLNTVALVVGAVAMVTVPRCPTVWTALAAVCVALAGGVLTNGAFEPNKFDICGQ